ncbi:YncE family protein [Microbacterium lacus]|uniref:YncE family protein n=1 Tax=Microbacterium lacus TaxID=415217 RepID=UPI00384B1628
MPTDLAVMTMEESGVADGRLLVVCKDDRSLDLLDLRGGRSLGVVLSSGVSPHEVIASLDGTIAYLPVYSDAPVGHAGSDGRAIDIVDLVEPALVRTERIPFAARPHLPQLGSDGMLYVSAELDESICVFDPHGMRLAGRLPTGAPQSHMFAISADGTSIAVANVQPGSVSIIDLREGSLRGVVNVAAKINRISFDAESRMAFTADQDTPRLAVIDTRDLRVVDWIALPGLGFGSAVTADGERLVIALRSTSQVAVVDLRTRSVVGVVDVPPRPQSIVLEPTGRYAYSACSEVDLVVEVDLERLCVQRLIPTGRNPDGLAWAPVPPSVAAQTH